MKPEQTGSGWAAQAQVQEELLPALQQAFPDGVTTLDTPFEITQVRVSPAQLVPVVTWLRDRGFNMLTDIGGVDYLGHPHCPAEGRLEVVYHLLALPQLWRIRLRVAVPEKAAQVPSLAALWGNAGPAECEVYDQFGVRFTGHPDLRRVLNPEDWEGHPLRKDYPLRGPRDLVPLMPAEANRFFPFKIDDSKGGEDR